MPPGFSTYAAPLGWAYGFFWLEIRYDGGTYEDGSPSGWAFVDNLRFE
jgi:hypothetical protein